jgi:hypothetical protein
MLAVVTPGRDVAEVLLKMPHIFPNVEYADMLYVYGSCDGSATAAVEEYHRPFPMGTIFYEQSQQPTDAPHQRKILRAKFKILRTKYRKPFRIGHMFI